VIKKILRTIRQKPKAVRQQYSFWIACVLTSVVVLAWVTQSFDQFGAQPDVSATSDNAISDADTLSRFMDDVQTQLGSVQQEVQVIIPAVAPSATTTATTSLGQTQSASLITAPRAPARLEVRIATTSASSTATP